MNRNAADGDVCVRHAPMAQIGGPLTGRAEIMIARLVHPQPMRFVIGRHGEMRRRQFVAFPQRGDQLGRQKVRVDDDVPRLGFQKPQERGHVQLLKRQSQTIGISLRRGGPIHQVVKVAQYVGCFVDEVEIGLAIHPPKSGVRELEHVEIPHFGGRVDLLERKFDRLGRPQVAGANGRGEDEHSFRHLRSPGE